MIRLGIVGCNYGRNVLLPAFRLDPRCRVVAIAGTNAARAATIAREEGIEAGYGDWKDLVRSASVDAVAIAIPPGFQAEIALAAMVLGKPVFAEKPMSDTLDGARSMLMHADGIVTAVDFEFTELVPWRQAKEMIAQGAIGALRQVSVVWEVETSSTRLRLKNWKTNLAAGGGALGNLASHSIHYLEWLGGPLSGLFARLAGLADAPDIQTAVTVNFQYTSGALGSFVLDCGASSGSGHRIELHGEAGTLVLANTSRDYMRGFGLQYGQRGEVFSDVAVALDPLDKKFPGESRIAPVSRLATRFLNALQGPQSPGSEAGPGFEQGYRVQVLLDAICRSHHSGRWINLQGEAAS